MYKVKTDTIIRTVVLIIALVNQVLTVCGYSVLPITDDQVAELLSLILTIGASLWSWWKNNSFTQNAIEADEVLECLKNRKTEV
jgi:SPP1 family holin